MRQDLQTRNERGGTGLVDVLDRVLDKGLVIAGDIKISLAEVELLTVRIRLIVCSLDKAEQVGIDWWKYDPNLSSTGRPLAFEDDALRKEIQTLHQKVAQLSEQLDAARGAGREPKEAPKPMPAGAAPPRPQNRPEAPPGAAKRPP